MGAFYDDIPEYLADWILNQHMFWVATAPLSPSGHVNVSPKGVAGTFKIIDNRTVMYQDLTGSGSETIAHLRENARITVMFQEFEGAPRIVRLFGTGIWHEFGSPEYERYIPAEERLPGSRAAIVVHVHKVGSSCGFAVPRYKFDSHRTQLLEHFAKREEKDASAENSLATDGLRHYWGFKNSASVDGMPALYIGEQYAKHFRLDPTSLSPFVPKKTAVQRAVGTVVDVKFLIGVMVGVLGVLFECVDWEALRHRMIQFFAQHP